MKKFIKKEILLSSLGSSFEYYDFIIYAFLSPYLLDVFSGGINKSCMLAEGFFIFSIAYLARPIGGLLFGMLGDRFGRKSSFLFSMLLMSFATLGIGLLPSYSAIGYVSVILLMFLRFLQGISFGAELPGAITYIAEFSSDKNKSYNLSWLMFGASMGSALASISMLILNTFLDQHSIHLWGWRIPFIFGGILAIASYFSRKYLEETPEFISYIASYKYEKNNFTLLYLLKFYKINILLALSILSFTSSTVIFVLYIPSYLNIFFNINSKNIYFAVTAGIIWAALILPIVGHLLQKFKKYKVFTAFTIIFILFCFLSYKFLISDNIISLIILISGLETFYVCLIGGTLSLVSELFPVKVRYTGVAISYNLAFVLFYLIPALISFIIYKTEFFFSAFLILQVIALISTCGCKISEKRLLEKKFVNKVSPFNLIKHELQYVNE